MVRLQPRLGAGVIRIDPQVDPRWDELVSRHPKATVWHSSAWLRVTERTYGYRPAHLAHEVEGRLEGILPLVIVRSRWTGTRLVSLPFSGPVGPIGSSAAVVDALVGAAIEATSALGCSYLSLTGRDDLDGAHARALASARPFVCSVLPLREGPDQLWLSALKNQVRKEIRRARRRGVSVRLADRPEHLREFYKLYARTARRHGMPPQPRELFDAMWETFQPAGQLILVEARLDERLIHAQVCLAFKDVLSVVYAGTDERFLSYHPVKLADWSAVELAWALGCRSVDFMQSHVRNPGLRWYKRSLGATEVPVTYYYYPSVGTTNTLREILVGGRSPLSGLIKACVRRAPLTALEALGRIAFRHVG
jgi:CelD/BcsL family acetyltransferase involved in cellulose biosynthesis